MLINMAMNMWFTKVLRPVPCFVSSQWPTVTLVCSVILLVGCATEQNKTSPLMFQQPSVHRAYSETTQGAYGRAEVKKRNEQETPKTTLSKAAMRVELLLFGGEGHDVFLGCLTCGKYDSGSVWNKYGSHGSRYSAESIWNPYGTYGSKYSSVSPWNRYGQSPPVIVDREGSFYGYFTTNLHLHNRTKIEWLLQILGNYESIIENYDEYIDSLW